MSPGSACLPVPGPIQRDEAQAGLSNRTSSGNVSRGNAMKAKSVVISVLCAGAVVGVAIWLAVGHQARFKLGEENRALRQQLDQMAAFAAENERLSNLVAQANRSQSLPGEQLKELLRLRGEVSVLRQQGKELETLRNENRQARAALESSLKTQSAGATAAAATADYWPRDSWAFVGYASPEAALQSSIWAGNKGDLKTFLGGTTGELQKMVEKDLEGKSESEVSAKVLAESARLKSVRVLNREVQADDTVVLTAAFEDGTDTHTTKLLMKKIGNEWKLSGPPR